MLWWWGVGGEEHGTVKPQQPCSCSASWQIFCPQALNPQEGGTQDEPANPGLSLTAHPFHCRPQHKGFHPVDCNPSSWSGVRMTKDQLLRVFILIVLQGDLGHVPQLVHPGYQSKKA